VAETFIDRYYIERDHDKALALCTGIAASRVASEKKLVDEARAAGVDSSAVLPHIYYQRTKSLPKGEDLEQSFTLKIDSGGVVLAKELRVVTRRVGDNYKVIFFNESEAP
jgi:hypothetical protein